MITDESWVRSHTSPCAISGVKCGNGAGFNPRVLGFCSVNIIPSLLHKRISFHSTTIEAI